MTVYLSNYWRKNKTINYILTFVYIVLGVLFIWWNKFESVEIFLMDIICISFPIVVIIYIQGTTVRTLMKKVLFTKDEITLISSKNKILTVNLNEKVYYEILCLKVAVYSSQKFIVLSNNPFEPLIKYKGLAEACKCLDKTNIQVIAPYNEKTIPWLKMDNWIRIGVQSGDRGDDRTGDRTGDGSMSCSENA